MIEHNLEFFNTDHLASVQGMNGLRLERFPELFGRRLGIEKNCNGRFRASRVHGCEIRFVTDAPCFDMGLSAVESDIDVCVYYGDMVHSHHRLQAGKVTVLHVEKHAVFQTIDEALLPKGRFSPGVWRIQFGMNGYAFFHYLDTFGHNYRPPQSEEKPEAVWAAYGSSITCGSVTALYSNCYIEQTARRLGVEVMNKGLSGSCLCETFTAEYLASLPVSILSLELGVNMIPFFGEAEFEKRVRSFLGIVTSSHAKRIYVIGIFPNKGLVTLDRHAPYYTGYRSFQKILDRIMKEMSSADGRFFYIPGEAVAPDMLCLSTDLLHPSDDGHILMGDNLAAWILKQENRNEEKKNGGTGYGMV